MDLEDLLEKEDPVALPDHLVLQEVLDHLEYRQTLSIMMKLKG